MKILKTPSTVWNPSMETVHKLLDFGLRVLIGPGLKFGQMKFDQYLNQDGQCSFEDSKYSALIF